MEATNQSAQGAQDLSDIGVLQRTISFSRYWLRRLGAERSAAEKALKYDTMSYEEREITRQRFLQLEKLEGMMDADKASIAASTLNSENAPKSQ